MLETLLVLSTAVNRLVEVVIKPLIPLTIPDDIRNLILVISSMVVGILAALGANLNLLAENEFYGQLNPVLGIVLTGIFLGAGSNVIQSVFGLIYGWKEQTKSQNLLRDAMIYNAVTEAEANERQSRPQ